MTLTEIANEIAERVRKFQPDAKVGRAGAAVRWTAGPQDRLAYREEAKSWLTLLRRDYKVVPGAPASIVTLYYCEHGRVEERQGLMTFRGVLPADWSLTRLEAAQECVKREEAELQAQQKRLEQARELLRAEVAGQR